MFTFRFKTLLSARRTAEELFQKELAEARRALAVEQAALRELRTSQRRCIYELQRIQQNGFHAPDVQLYAPYLSRLKRDIERQNKRVASAERNMTRTRRALIDAVKKRKALEKLQDKDLQAHLNTLALSERKFMDDVAAQIFSKSSSSGGGCGGN